MDLDLFAIAVLLTLAGLYMLEAALASAPVQELPRRVLKPARTALERAWLAEPVQVFMRQLLSARQRRASRWRWDLEGR